MQVNLLYTHNNMMGYGRFGTNLSRELANLDVEVFDNADGAIAEEYFANPDRNVGRANVMCLLSVPSHGQGWWKGQVPCVYTMWEAQRLPESFRECLHHYDTVIVPSMQNVELFGRYHDNVKYVPLGVDPKDWHYQPRSMPGSTFRFLFGGSGKRKGGDLAVAAFKRLWGREGSWGDGPIPILTMKSPNGDQFYGQRIETVSGKLSDADEVALYARAHCYLQPSRGEGFGLQPLQAIAQGCPTILTGAHGHEAFMHLGLPISATESEAEYFIYGDAGTWWEPSLDELCDMMADVYKNYDLHVADAEINAGLAAKFTWENSARGLIDAIGADRLGPYTGPDEWYTVDAKKYKIVTRRDWKCDIAGYDYFFHKGKEYWQLADVKRILFENGVLDPSCLDDDDPDGGGLTEAQVAKAGKYRAEYENCPTCGHRLN